MSIFQRGDIWYVDYYDGKKRVKKVIGKRKTDAIAYEGKIRAAKRENRLFDMKKEYNHTFDEVLERYKEAFEHQRSYKDKIYHFPVFEKAFSGKLLAEITPYDLEKFRNERKATLTRSSKERTVADVNRSFSTFRHMFSKAVEWEMMEKSPFAKARNLFYRENNERLRFLTEDEWERLESHCKGHLSHIVITAKNTGMRKAEILTLKWPDIRNGFIYLTETKTDIPRQIPINDTLNELFQSLPRHIHSEYVFCRKDGQPFSDISKGFKAALKKAGIKDFTFHDLRHTFASWLVMRGASLKAVQELLGHKKIEMTMRYAHLSDDFKVDAVKLLDDKCSPKVGTLGNASNK